MQENIVNWQPGHLQDEVVKIVPLKETDFEELYNVASDPLIWEQHPSGDRYLKHVFQAYFDGAVSSKTAFLIVDKLTNEIIGSTRYYDISPENNSVAIGFTFLARKCWGGHYNRLSKTLLFEYAFQHVDNVILHIGANNLRSQIATTKLGARKTGEVLRETQGGVTYNYEYIIEKHEWEMNKINLANAIR